MKVFNIFVYQDFTMTEQHYRFMLILYNKYYAIISFASKNVSSTCDGHYRIHDDISEYFTKSCITNFFFCYVVKYIYSARKVFFQYVPHIENSEQTLKRITFSCATRDANRKMHIFTFEFYE